MPEPAAILTRRRLLQFAAAGAPGLSLGGLWRARAVAGAMVAPTTGLPPIRACILIFYYGGPSQLETFDPKPDAPAEIRGPFAAIPTAVPGTFVSEHLPRMARLMDRVALVRTMSHRSTLHDSASIHALTGRQLEGPDRELFSPLPQVYPSYGSAVAALRPGGVGPVPFATLPFAFRNVHPVPCQGGGFLGSAFDPLLVEVDPASRSYRAGPLGEPEGVPAGRLRGRRDLLGRLDADAGGRPHPWGPLRERAYGLLDSEPIRRAVDIASEPAWVRDRYGFDADPLPHGRGSGGGGGNGAELGAARQMRGQNLLLARRLVEAGVPFVNVHDFQQQGQNWDAHFRCGDQHKDYLLPQADRSLSALIEDLEGRGLLDSTLVVVTGEFGRTPRINGEAGRDHWPNCYTVLLAGGGVAGGAIHGASDRSAAYPARDPATPGDLAATIFWRFGIDPATEVRDQEGRPHRLADGEPLRALFGA